MKEWKVLRSPRTRERSIDTGDHYWCPPYHRAGGVETGPACQSNRPCTCVSVHLNIGWGLGSWYKTTRDVVSQAGCIDLARKWKIRGKWTKMRWEKYVLVTCEGFWVHVGRANENKQSCKLAHYRILSVWHLVRPLHTRFSHVTGTDLFLVALGDEIRAQLAS